MDCNSRIFGRKLALLLSTVALVVADGYHKPAIAQQEDTTVGDAILLDTIIIGGEKFLRDLFSTYSSVDVVTSEELDAYTSNTIDEALNRSANVRSFESGAGNSSFVIRGLNSDGVTQPSRSTPVISVMVDGAPQGVETTRRGSRGVWDIDQIEVLRGPQSTIQGRDSLAGSIQVTTKDPTWEPELFYEGIVGSNDLVSGAFAISTPILEDQLAIRVSGQAFRETKDIAYTNPDLASLGQEEFEEIRGKILWTPDALPGFTGLFTVSHTHDKPAWGLVSGPDFFAREFTDPSSAAEFRDTVVDRYIADLTYEISPVWTLKSVTSFVDTHQKIDTPDGYASYRDDVRDYGDLAQDLQLTYDNPDSAFSGVFGLYAGRYDAQLKSDYKTTGFAAYGVPEADIQQLDGTNLTESVAAYADMRYDIGDRLTLLGGGRVLHDMVSTDYSGHVVNVDDTIAAIFGGCTLVDPDTCPVYDDVSENSSVENTVFLPKAGLAFDLTETQTIAATASRGYRAGFAELYIGTTDINVVDPEYLWSYELAYRSKWLDDTLQVNASAFYYDYTNQQIPVFLDAYPGQTYTVNAASSHAYGAEIDVSWQAMPGIDLFSSIGLLKTQFDEGVVRLNNADVDLAGYEFPEAPAVTASIGGVWTHDTGFFVGGDLTYTDGFYSKGALDNRAAQYLDSFTVVNMQLGYETENVKMTAFAKNLFDEQYLTSISSSGSLATIGDGRSFGLQVNGKF